MKTNKLFKPIVVSLFVACWLGLSASNALAADTSATKSHDAFATIVSTISFSGTQTTLDFGAIVKSNLSNTENIFQIFVDGTRISPTGGGNGHTGTGQRAGEITVLGTNDALFQLSSTSAFPIDCSGGGPVQTVELTLIRVSRNKNVDTPLPLTSLMTPGGLAIVFIGGLLKVKDNATDGPKTCTYNLTATYQ